LKIEKRLSCDTDGLISSDLILREVSHLTDLKDEERSL
jgi:hypothetical protein